MFNIVKSAGTSNKNGNVLTCDAKAVDVKVERESYDEVQQNETGLYEYTYHVIKHEVAVELEGPQHDVYSSNCSEQMHSESSAKTSEPSQNHSSNDLNGSIIKIETEAMSTVREETTEELYTGHEIKDEIVIGPVVLQAVSYKMLEKNEMHSESNAKTSEQSQNHNSNDHNRFIIKLGTEATSTVREEHIEDHEIKEIMVIGPAMLQAFTYMLEKTGESLPKKPRLDTQDKTTEPDNTAKQTRTETNTEEMKLKDCNQNTEPSDTKLIENVKNNIGTKTFKPRNNTQKNIRNDKNKTTKNIFQCNVCAKQYNKIPDLVQHIESHDKTKHYFKCKECTYQSITQDSLDRHLKLHDKSRRFVCDVCGYRYMDHMQLQQHLRYVHPGEKMHCGICDYKTHNIYNLNRHIKKHSGETGEKPYSCTLCEYKCSHKCHLEAHSRIHTGEKPYSCSLCEYTCNQKMNLRTHSRIHTGERPYSCSECNLKFSDKSNLKRHLRTHCK